MLLLLVASCGAVALLWWIAFLLQSVVHERVFFVFFCLLSQNAEQ